MIPYETALAIVREVSARRSGGLPTVSSPLVEAVGGVLARDLVSPRAVPSFANSAMDGFAVATSELSGEPSSPTLRIAGVIAVGDRQPHAQRSEQLAWEIMTGAPIPDACDAVIRVEDTERLAGDRVRLARVPTPGENVRPAGEDIQPGAPLLPAGTRVTPEHVMALASLGFAHIPVRRRPRIAVISTGPELVELSADAGELPVGRIYNSSAPYLSASLSLVGADVSYFGTVADDPAVFHPLLQNVLRSEPDLILTTGAVSMGKHDFILPALADAGARVLFHRVAIRPGKPIVMAEWPDRQTVFFGLPGNPVSTAVGARFFVEPWLREFLGQAPERSIRVALADGVSKAQGLRCFLKARVDLDRREVRALAGQASSLVSPLLRANAWLVAPEGRARWEQGESLEIFPVSAGIPLVGDLW